MPKLLVISTLNMTDQELREYAEDIPNRVKGLTAEKFLQDLRKDQQVKVKYHDKTITVYQLIKELN